MSSYPDSVLSCVVLNMLLISLYINLHIHGENKTIGMHVIYMLAAIFTTTIIGYPLQYPWASLVAQMVKNLPAMQEIPVQFLGWKNPLRRDRLPISVLLSFPSGSDGKESTCNMGDLSSTLRWEDPLEEGMAAHSSILAWRFPWTEEPGGLESIEPHRVGHN